jgi:hypothetical protein
MSYLHCPTCKRAYNISTDSVCPYCPVPAIMVDPTEDIVAAAEQLARAMARATPPQRHAAMQRMDVLALPAPGAKPVTFHGGMMRSIREALEPAAPAAPAAPPKPQPLLAAIAFAVLERIGERAPRLRRAGSLLRARVRALAA